MSRSTGARGRSPVLRVATSRKTGAAEAVLDAAVDADASVPVVWTGPTGLAAVDPLVLATAGGQTALYPDASTENIRDIAAALADGAVPTADALAVCTHDPEAMTLPTPDSGPLAVGRRSVLGPCGWADPLAAADWDLVSTTRSAALVSDYGILGRGRGDAAADEPVADVWETARNTAGETVLVVNANGAGGRSDADELLLTAAPLAVLDGVSAVADAVDATDVVISLNEGATHLHRHVRDALGSASELGIDPQLVAGPDAYRAVEPTAALEALEGADRVEPRLQPPTPAEHGLHGRPTVVHTPRTFAQVRQAMLDESAVDPDAADPGTRLVTVGGDVAAPATVELGSGDSLDAVRDAVAMEGSFKMACVGGTLGGITRDLDVPAAGPSLRSAGLGTDGVVELLNGDRCALATAGERARFAATENSGRCVPGREGTVQLADLLRDVYDGEFETDKIRELGRVMRRSSNCKVGAHAPRPVTTAIDQFEPEFRAHADGHCPSGACTEQR